jgi:hypothetical protein
MLTRFFILSVIMLNANMLSFVTLTVVMLTVRVVVFIVMFSVILLNVTTSNDKCFNHLKLSLKYLNLKK